jgi:hypothetical protein
MSEEESEQQLNGETAELKFAARWKASAIGEENDMRDHDDLLTDEEDLQSRRLHKENQPLEQLDRVIEEIRKMMLRSIEVFNKGELNKRDPTIAAVKNQKKKKKQQQQHSWRGARGQLHKRIWNPGGFQHWGRGAHEREIMFFLAGEYDLGALLHLSKCTNTPAHKHTMEKGRGIKPPIFKFEIILYKFLCCKVVNVGPCLCIGSGWISFKGFLVAGPNRSQV